MSVADIDLVRFCPDLYISVANFSKGKITIDLHQIIKEIMYGKLLIIFT